MGHNNNNMGIIGGTIIRIRVAMAIVMGESLVL